MDSNQNINKYYQYNMCNNYKKITNLIIFYFNEKVLCIYKNILFFLK
jgi:hypothetical protein